MKELSVMQMEELEGGSLWGCVAAQANGGAAIVAGGLACVAISGGICAVGIIGASLWGLAAGWGIGANC